MIQWTLKSDVLVRRYKRFLADTESGLTLHCPNTGAMTGLAQAGAEIAYAPREGGKTAGRWTLVKAQGEWACIDSQLANQWVRAGLKAAQWPDFKRFVWRPEVKLEDSRIDFLGQADSQNWWLEVKGVTLALGQGEGAFPDTVSVRAHKHLDRLTQRASQGDRASVMYVLMHNGIDWVRPAQEIDPVYAQKVAEAKLSGVEFFYLPTHIDLLGVDWQSPVALD